MNTQPVPGTPTQVAHPWKAVVRTLVASGVGVALAWTARVLGIDLAGLEAEIVNSLSLGVWALITGAVQWLLSRPKLQGFWTAIGLGTGVEKEEYGRYEAGRPEDDTPRNAGGLYDI